MDHQQQAYRLFVLTNRIASLRRKILPAGTRREKFYRNFVRPLAASILTALLNQRFFHKSSESHQNPLFQFDSGILPPLEQIKSILIIKADHIGDFVFALPAFQALSQSFPRAKITLLCGAWNRSLAEASGLFHEVICANIYEQRIQEGLASSPNDILVQLNQLPVYDIALDLKHEPDTRFLLGLVKAKFKAGFSSPLMPDNMSLVIPSFPATQTSHNVHTRTLLLILAQAVIASFSAQQTTSMLMQNLASHLESRPRPPNISFLIGINTGSGATAKNWPISSFIHFAKRIIVDHEVKFVLFGTQAEKEAASLLISEIGNDHILDYTEILSLSEFVSFVSKVDLYIGHDTGSTHIAAALNIPTICLYSGTGILERMAPTGQKLIILKNEVPCMPCGLRDIRDCHHHHECMTGITVDRVMTAIKKLLLNPST